MNEEQLRAIEAAAQYGVSSVVVLNLIAEVRSLRAKLEAVPVDAIGIYYQWSEFQGAGDPGAEAAQAALNAWLDQQPGWNASPELPTIREFNQSGTADSSDDYSSTDATRPVRRRGNRD